MNKKAEVSIAVIIIIAIVGLIFAQYSGLFEIFTPDVGQPSGTDSLVNKVYYPATSSGPGSCDILNSANFRTTDIDYSYGSRIAYSPECGSSLEIYKSTGSLASSATSCERILDEVLIESVPCDISRKSGTDCDFGIRGSSYQVCYITTTGKANTKSFKLSEGDISTSNLYTGDPNEVPCGNAPIKDEGIYACSGGNVVTQFCGNFGSELVYDCPSNQQCEPLTNFETDSGFQEIVKCSGNYVPNQNLCVGNTLFQTTLDGSEITSTVCGYLCSNNACVECQSGQKRCAQLDETTTNIEICSGGQWTQWTDASATCIGDQTCVNGACTSEYSDGMERCNNKQPQRYSGSTQTWINDGDLCDIQCNEVSSTEVSCTKECETPGYYCGAGELYDCQDTDRDYEDVRIGTCISGYCSTDNSKCLPTRDLGDKYCSGNEIYKAISSGDEYDLFGGITGQLQTTCANSCVPVGTSDAECSKIAGCEDNAGLSICLNQFERATCSLDEQSYASQEDCSDTLTNGFCEIQSGVGVCSEPESQCTGDLLCSSGVIRSCDEGDIGDEIFGCNALGCQTLSSGLPICNDECTSLDEYSCRDGDSSICAYDEDTSTLISQKQKLWKLANACGNLGCEDSTGKCTIQCTGTKLCSAGKIRSCDEGIIGDVIDECNDQGCDDSTDICLDECSVLDSYQCQSQDSYQCVQKENNQLILELAQDCSSEGCDIPSGRCIVSGTPNTYTCIGEDRSGDLKGDDLWFINQEGFLDNLVSQCAAGQEDYCSQGVSYCKFCEQNYISCSDDGAQEIRCNNDQTGELEVLDNCEVGCFVQNLRRYCDDLVVIISESQNFLVDETVSIKGLLKGSESENGIAVSTLSVTLEGAGETDILAGASGTSGNFDINFGSKAVGEYVATIDLPDYNQQYIINVKVTNDFIIRLYGTEVLTSIPGTTPYTELEVVGGSGEPDDLVEIETPSGITNIEITKTSVSGRWNLQVDGEPGVYQLKLAAVENGVTLDPYTISIELRKPSLELTSNIPESSKPGTKEFEIKVLAPQLVSGIMQTDSIEPDSISMTINGELYDLSSGSLGNGRYLIEYDFEIGTYTVNVDADLAGYDPISSSHQIQVSASGKDLPPSSTTTGGTTSEDTGDDTTDDPKEPLDSKTVAIIAIVLVVGYFVLKKN